MVIFRYCGLLLCLGSLFGCSLSVGFFAPVQQPEALQVTDLQGSPINMEELFSRHDATVLIWWATGCPCVKRYQTRMEELASRKFAQGKAVAVLAVSSNADENCEQVAQEANNRNFKVPIIRDHNGALAHFAGASTTPTAVIVGKDGKIKFVGWIDNERFPDEADREAYLDNALSELLSGKEVVMARAPTWGCMITKKFSMS